MDGKARRALMVATSYNPGDLAAQALVAWQLSIARA
jgi:hypothetical protein